MPLARTRTYVGKPRKNVRRRGNTKANKRRAYKPARKRQVVNAMRPMVETKSRTTEEVALAAGSTEIVDSTAYQTIANDDAVTLLPLVPFNTQHQGLNEDEMIGHSIYARWLKCKMTIKLPEGVNAIQHAADLYLVSGYVKAPIAATSFTTLTPSDIGPAQISDHISKHIKDFLDEREDNLRFISKQNTNIKITGYKRLKPNRNGSLGAPSQVYSNSLVPTGFRTAGANPIIKTSVTFKMMRKIHYTHGKTLGMYQTLFPNSGYLPFVCIYNPTFDSFADSNDARIQIASNQCLWYSDQ